MPSFIDEYTFEIEASFDINAGKKCRMKKRLNIS